MQLTKAEYSILVQQAPLMIWRSGLDGKCDFFNDRWLEFTGRMFEQELGDGWLEGVHPHDRAECMREYLAHFKARQPFEIYYRLKRYDREYRWIQDNGGPFELEDGSFGGFIGSAIDITEAKEARDLIRMRQEERIRTLEGLLPVCSNCKRIQNENGRWERLDVYLRERVKAEFSQSLCPSCAPLFENEHDTPA